MYSRNLYEIDEVCILLFQSIHGKRKTEANFWAHELYVSFEIDLLKNVLKLCAILFAPTYAIYNYTINSKTPEDYEHIINVLCYCSNKQSIHEYNLFSAINILSETKDGYETTPITPDKTTNTNTNTNTNIIYINSVLQNTIMNNQYIRCAAILNTHSIELFNIEKDFKTLYSSLPKEWHNFKIHALARWLINKEFVDYKGEQTNNWCRWTKIQGTKEARLVAINPAVLKHWIDRPDWLIKMKGDPIQIFDNGSAYFKQFDHTKLEDCDFFFEVFKDDIPDEWSNEECLKSHSTPTKNTSFNDYGILIQKICI